jgi:hypothetical protein
MLNVRKDVDALLAAATDKTATAEEMQLIRAMNEELANIPESDEGGVSKAFEICYERMEKALKAKKKSDDEDAEDAEGAEDSEDNAGGSEGEGGEDKDDDEEEDEDEDEGEEKVQKSLIDGVLEAGVSDLEGVAEDLGEEAEATPVLQSLADSLAAVQKSLQLILKNQTSLQAEQAQLKKSLAAAPKAEGPMDDARIVAIITEAIEKSVAGQVREVQGSQSELRQAISALAADVDGTVTSKHPTLAKSFGDLSGAVNAADATRMLKKSLQLGKISEDTAQTALLKVRFQDPMQVLRQTLSDEELKARMQELR